MKNSEFKPGLLHKKLNLSFILPKAEELDKFEGRLKNSKVHMTMSYLSLMAFLPMVSKYCKIEGECEPRGDSVEK